MAASFACCSRSASVAKLRWLGASATLLLLSCESATVPARDRTEAYDFRLPFPQDSLVLRWPNSSRVRVFVNPGANDEQTTLLNAAYRLGTVAWERASLYVDYRFTQVGSAEQADVIVTWSGATLPVETAQCPPGGGFAFTTFCVNAERNRLVPFPLRASTMPSSVRFLVTIRETSATNPARVRSLLAHEMGHVLGIAQHSPNPEDLMFTDPLVREVPNTRDRVTVQILYQTHANITP